MQSDTKSVKAVFVTLSHLVDVGHVDFDYYFRHVSYIAQPANHASSG